MQGYAGRLLRVNLTSGMVEGESLRLRGWTGNGVPSEKRLGELGLGYVVKDMAPFLEKSTAG